MKKYIYTQEAITTTLHNCQVDSNTFCNSGPIFVLPGSTYQCQDWWEMTSQMFSPPHAIKTAFHTEHSSGPQTVQSGTRDPAKMADVGRHSYQNR